MNGQMVGRGTFDQISGFHRLTFNGCALAEEMDN
jgi:hypothetical protein